MGHIILHFWLGRCPCVTLHCCMRSAYVNGVSEHAELQ